MSTYHTALIVLGTAFTVAVACVVRYRYLQSALLIRKFTVAVASMLRNLQNTLLSGEKPPVVKAIEHPGRTAAIREAMGKQLQFLQDIPQDQRTQRHSMQIEYYLLAEKCAEIAYMSHQAIVQEEPLHVAIAKLGDPAVFHAMLARMYFMAQVGLCGRSQHTKRLPVSTCCWGLLICYWVRGGGVSARVGLIAKFPWLSYMFHRVLRDDDNLIADEVNLLTILPAVPSVRVRLWKSHCIDLNVGTMGNHSETGRHVFRQHPAP